MVLRRVFLKVKVMILFIIIFLLYFISALGIYDRSKLHDKNKKQQQDIDMLIEAVKNLQKRL